MQRIVLLFPVSNVVEDVLFAESYGTPVGELVVGNPDRGDDGVHQKLQNHEWHEEHVPQDFLENSHGQNI